MITGESSLTFTVTSAFTAGSVKVPYTGATQNLIMGSNSVSAESVSAGSFIGNGSLLTGIAAGGGGVPYSGATANLDLGSFGVSAASSAGNVAPKPWWYGKLYVNYADGDPTSWAVTNTFFDGQPFDSSYQRRISPGAIFTTVSASHWVRFTVPEDMIVNAIRYYLIPHRGQTTPDPITGAMTGVEWSNGVFVAAIYHEATSAKIWSVWGGSISGLSPMSMTADSTISSAATGFFGITSGCPFSLSGGHAYWFGFSTSAYNSKYPNTFHSMAMLCPLRPPYHHMSLVAGYYPELSSRGTLTAIPIWQYRFSREAGVGVQWPSTLPKFSSTSIIGPMTLNNLGFNVPTVPIFFLDSSSAGAT